MCFAIVPYSSNYYNFDSKSRDNVGQTNENGSSLSIKFLTFEHVLNFIKTTYLVNNQLQHVYKNHFFLPEAIKG